VLTSTTLVATVALVQRRVRPARAAVPFSTYAVNVMPRLAPAALAVLAVTGMGASSWALVDARSSRTSEQPPAVRVESTTTVPELLGTTPEAPPTTVTVEPTEELAGAPVATAPSAGAGEDRGTGAAPQLIGTVTGVVGDVVAPVTDVVDDVLSPPTTVAPPTTLAPPTTVPAPTVSVPVTAPADPFRDLMAFAFQWYLVAAAVQRG
jgi:hypothetical protein